MKIFSIKHDNFSWDCYSGHVIVADNEKQVRRLAKINHRDEGKDIWNYAEVMEQGVYTGLETKPFILLSDFNAG